MTLILSGTNGLSDVDGSASTPAIRGTDTNTGIFFPAADTIAFAEGGAEVARFDSSGNFGINTTSPGTFGKFALQVDGTTTPTNATNVGPSSISLYAAANGSSTNSTVGIFGWQASQPGIGSGIGFSRENSSDWGSQIRFYTHPTTTSNISDLTERARITSDGFMLVGATSTAQGSGNGNKLVPNGGLYVVNAATNDGFSYYNSSASAYRFYVSSGGTISATNTTISAISDQRFKENIQDLDVGLSQIMELKPRKFDWKAGKGKDIKADRGWIAQEFEQVFPDMIDTWKDPAPEGEEPYKSVRADLIPVLVKAIQEQQALIESLTARIAALEAK